MLKSLGLFIFSFQHAKKNIFSLAYTVSYIFALLVQECHMTDTTALQLSPAHFAARFVYNFSSS